MLGISRQSFGRRLRRAERNVFEALFWEALDG
jgi:predicted DNA binding protein